MGKNNKSSKPAGQSRGRKKIVLEFDEDNRREFLTGFRKRKLERKARARKEVEDKLIKERKQIKAEIKENFFSQYKKSFAPIPELDVEEKEEEYEDDEVNVKIVELSTTEMARENNWIGANRGKLQESSSEDEASEEEEQPEEAVPGMSVDVPKPKKVKETASKTPVDKEKKEITSKKELVRMVHDKTSKLIKASKAFKMKKTLDTMKMRRKARGEKRKKVHLLKQQSKKRGGKHKDFIKKQNSKKPKSGKSRDKK